MNKTDHILSRALAGPFFRQHAGFFLFAFFLLFGTQPSFNDALRFHYAIVKSILDSFTFYTIALVIWTIYALKTIHFFYSHLQKRSFRFLYVLNALPPRRRLISLFRLQTYLFTPVWIYFIFIGMVAVREKYYAGLVSVFIAMSVLNIISVILYNYFLRKGGSVLFSRFGRMITRPWPKTMAVFLIRFIFTEQFITILIIKIVSFFTLYSFARLDGQVYEDRIIWLIYITLLIGHSMITYKNHHFIENKLLFYRNLPARSFSTLVSFFLVYLLLLIPEIWALKGVWVSQHQAMDYLWMICTGPSFLLLMHCLLYTDDMKIEGYLQLLFGIWVVSIFFSLSADRWMLPLICLVMACIVFFTSYHRYEKNVSTDGLE